VAELKIILAKKRQRSGMAEVEAFVTRTESELKAVKDACMFFGDSQKIDKLSEDEVRALGAVAIAAEKKASDTLTEARRFLSSRQTALRLDVNDKEGAASLATLQTRLANIRTELAKQRGLTGSVENLISTKRLIGETRSKVDQVEEQVATAASAAEVSENSDVAETATAEKTVQAAMLAARTLVRQIELHTRSHHSAKQALVILETRAKAAQTRIEDVQVAARQRSEDKLLRSIIVEIDEQVAECKAKVEKASDAESAAILVKKTPTAVADFEKAVQEVHGLAGKTKTFLSLKRIGLRSLSEISRCTAEIALEKGQNTVDKIAQDVANMRTRLAVLKR